ncbi:hypothetical protein KI387_020960, partial [Taxus chinensis]
CRLYSTSSEALGSKQRHLLESTPDGVKEQSFQGSSMYYGQSVQFGDIFHGKKEDQSQLEMTVKQLEEAMDPFNLECTTRGNWWE